RMGGRGGWGVGRGRGGGSGRGGAGQTDGFLEFRDRFFVRLFLFQRLRQIGMSLGAARIHIQSLSKLIDGRSVPARYMQVPSEVCVLVDRKRIEFQGTPNFPDCLVEAAQEREV